MAKPIDVAVDVKSGTVTCDPPTLTCGPGQKIHFKAPQSKSCDLKFDLSAPTPGAPKWPFAEDLPANGKQNVPAGQMKELTLRRVSQTQDVEYKYDVEVNGYATLDPIIIVTK